SPEMPEPRLRGTGGEHAGGRDDRTAGTPGLARAADAARRADRRRPPVGALPTRCANARLLCPDAAVADLADGRQLRRPAGAATTSAGPLHAGRLGAAAAVDAGAQPHARRRDAADSA